MFKRIFAIAVAMLSLTVVLAQKKDGGSFTLLLGPSFPVGNFGNAKIDQEGAGFAKTGLFMEIGYSHPLSKKFGLSVILHGQQNALNTGKLETEFGNANIYTSMPFMSDGTTPPPPPTYSKYADWKFEKNKWRMASLMLGGYGQFQLGSPRFVIIAKALAGPASVSSPEVEGSSLSDTASVAFKQTGKRAAGVGYLIGGGVYCEIAPKVFFTGRLDFFGTNKITFEPVTASIIITKHDPSNPAGVSVQQRSVTGTAKQNVSSVNLGIGICIRL